VSLVRPRALVPLAALLFAAAFLCAHLAARSSPNSSKSSDAGISLPTEDRIESPGWWPTKSAASLSKFVGAAECAKCHTQIAATQKTTPMAQAATPAADSEILKSHSDLTDQRAAYHYELSTSQNAVNFSVTDGAQSLSATIAWAFGLGHKGQTYIYERDGGFYESHLSFYKSLQALDLTTGHDADNPDDLKSAMGRWLDADEARRCFACHTTASSIAGHFDTSHLTPGVQCESCHGPGANHVAAMKSGKIEQGRAAIFNPRRLNPVASVDFCGACHRTWADVIVGEQKLRSVMNVRFQPYRLEDSKCWRNSNGDSRLTCIACHNPHEQLNQDASSYDSKCLTCHSPAGTAGNSTAKTATKICPKARSNCISCHMPQVEVPTIHATFFDHQIRVVRPNAPYSP
jgi:Cytochrome c3